MSNIYVFLFSSGYGDIFESPYNFDLFFYMGVTKPCTHLHPALSTSTQLYPPPQSSFPQRYYSQNITDNWAISPNLGRKIHSCPFWLKISTHAILEVLIPNPDLDFWNSGPKIPFGANLGQKSQSCPFCLKIAPHGISRMLILIPIFVFWISEPKSIFGQIWTKKVKVVNFAWKLAYRLSRGCWFLLRH